jgi:hypothetical protein
MTCNLPVRTAGGVLQDRSLYFWSKYSSVLALISDFLDDYADARLRANTLDARVCSDASGISSNYAAFCAISLRQAVGATETTISKTPSGAWNTSDVLMFMKEISSDGVGGHDARVCIGLAARRT